MVFGSYADYYDLFYKNKSYLAECRFVRNLFTRYATVPVKNIVDLGCGSASHAIALANGGLHVTGVDASARMLSLARAKLVGQDCNVKLVQAKLQSVKLVQKFDAAICMFSVIDYLTSDADLKHMLKNVNTHLKYGGVFVCDFWHARAVTSFTPIKNKIYRQGDLKVERVSCSKLLSQKRICEVQYSCNVKVKGKLIKTIHETHRMRYFDVEEMQDLLKGCGLTPVGVGPFMNIDKIIRKNTWDVTIVARRE